MSSSKDDNTKQKQRDILWKNKANFYITDFQGDRVPEEKGVFVPLADDFKAGRGLLLHVCSYPMHLFSRSVSCVCMFAELIKLNNHCNIN